MGRCGQRGRAVLIIAFVVLMPLRVAAGEEIALAELRARALAESPVVREIDARLAAELAEAIEARQRLNPELSGEFRAPVAWTEERGEVEFGAGLIQPLRLSDGALRREVAAALERAASSEQRLALLQLSVAISREYARLWAATEEEQILRGEAAVAERQIRVVREAAARGVGSRLELQLLEAEAALAEGQLLGARGIEAALRAQLMEQTGVRLDTQELVRPVLAPLPPLETLLAAARESSLGAPARLRLASEAAASRARLVERDRFGPVAPALLYERSDSDTHRVGLGVTLELPFFDRNEGARAREEAAAAAARAKLRYVHDGVLEQEISLRHKAATLADAQRKLFGERVIPALERALRLQTDQQAAGQASAVDSWRIRRDLNSARREALRRWVEAWEIRSELSLLVGAEL